MKQVKAIKAHDRTVGKAAAFLSAIAFGCACLPPMTSHADETTVAVIIKNGNMLSYSSDQMDSAFTEAMDSGRTLELENDWRAGKVIVIPSGKTMNLDLNGHIIDRGLLKYEDEGALFKVESGASLNITDSDPQAEHKGYAAKGGILTGGKSGNTAGCIEMKSGSAVTLEGCSIVSCASQQDGGAVRMDGVCELTADGTGFYSNYTLDSSDESYGGAIYVGDGTAFIRNCVFDGNYSEDDGGAVYMNDGELQLSSTMFRSNHAKEEGGAIYCNGTYNPSMIDGCTFVSNSADEDGGAVYVNGCKQLVINDSVFSLNTTGENGGAIYVISDKVILAGSTVTGNKAEQNGGGVYVDSKHDLGVQGKVIVRGNTNSSGNNNDLCLQSGVASTAYLSNGGLYEGSMIYLTSTTASRIRAAKDISKFQTSNYIRSNYGSAVIDEKTEYKVEERFVSSVIGDGNTTAIVGGSVVIVLAALTVSVKKRKAKGANRA